jgi:hypothetical protein
VAADPTDDEATAHAPSGDPTPVGIAAPPTRPTRGLGRRWLLFFVALFPLTAVWSLTNPMFASPDETAHIVRAQSFARGDFSLPYTTDGLPVDEVDCFRYRPDATADCANLEWGPDGTQRIAKTDGYPPLFHAIAAVPAVFVSGLAGTYLMRLWVAAVVVALFAWAGALITRQRLGPLPLAGFVLALTPMVVMISSTVNPSGLAMGSALVFVAGVLSWHLERPPEPTAWIAIVVGAAGSALGRRDGVLWLGLLCLCLLPLVGPRLMAGVRRRRSQAIAIGAGIAAAALVIGVVWGRTTVSRFVRNGFDGRGTDPWEVLRGLRIHLYELVGVFGWLDAAIGEEAFLFAAVLYGALITLGLVGNSRRLVVSTALALAAMLLSPVAVGLFTFPYMQGRYLFPLLAGLMLLAAVSASFGDTGPRFDRRVTVVLLGGWGILQVVGGVQNLRRYAVGWGQSWRFVIEADWHPIFMPNAVAVLCYLGAVALALVVFGRVLREMPAGRG